MRHSQQRLRGSLLITSLLVLVMVMTLGIAQQTRSLSSVQISKGYQAQAELFNLSEARVDEALNILSTTPTFGGATNTCTGDWDCWPSSTLTPLPNSIPTQTFIRAMNISSPSPGTTRKRVRVETTHDKTNQTTVHELLVEVTQPTPPGLRAGRRLVLLGGNATNRTTIVADEVASFGAQIFAGNSPPVEVLGSSIIQGRVVVRAPNGDTTTPQSQLCCATTTPASYISLGVGSATASAYAKLIRHGDNITLPNPDQSDILATNPGRSNAATNGLNTNLANDQDYPRWTSEQWDPDPVDLPSHCPATKPDAQVGSSGTEEHVFCREGDADINCDEKIGTLDEDGTTMLYCFNSLRIWGGNAINYNKAFFKNDNGKQVKVYLNGYLVNTQKFALLTGAYAVIEACASPPCSNTPTMPETKAIPLSFNVVSTVDATAKVKFGGLVDLHATVNAPNHEVIFGASAGDVVTANEPQYIVADTITISGGTTVRFGTQGSNEQEVTVKLLGWRRCLTPTCDT